jgi:hypothetical protein
MNVQTTSFDMLRKFSADLPREFLVKSERILKRVGVAPILLVNDFASKAHG